MDQWKSSKQCPDDKAPALPCVNAYPTTVAVSRSPFEPPICTVTLITTACVAIRSYTWHSRTGRHHFLPETSRIMHRYCPAATRAGDKHQNRESNAGEHAVRSTRKAHNEFSSPTRRSRIRGLFQENRSRALRPLRLGRFQRSVALRVAALPQGRMHDY
jgi:hypothetical protein